MASWCVPAPECATLLVVLILHVSLWCAFAEAISRALPVHAQEQGEGWHEVALLGLHYCWVAGACLTALSPAKAAGFFVLAQCLSGFLLSIVFVQSHNGMTIHNKPTDFVTAQVLSTRDILSSAWTDWFTGQ